MAITIRAERAPGHPPLHRDRCSGIRSGLPRSARRVRACGDAATGKASSDLIRDESSCMPASVFIFFFFFFFEPHQSDHRRMLRGWGSNLNAAPCRAKVSPSPYRRFKLDYAALEDEAREAGAGGIWGRHGSRPVGPTAAIPKHGGDPLMSGANRQHVPTRGGYRVRPSIARRLRHQGQYQPRRDRILSHPRTALPDRP